MKDSSVALFKIEKLLEKIEKDIKKHQDKEIYRESDKYMRHAQKTIDLYSLTLDEVLCTPGQVNLQRHCTVLKRMFKGMQGQVKSVLKFALYHFKQRSEKLEEQYDDGTGSPSNVVDAQRGSANTFDNRGSTSGSPTSLATFSRNGKPNFTMMLPNVQMSPQNLSSSPQSLYTMRNSARSPISNYSRGGDFVLQNGTYNGYAEEKGQWGSLNQFGDNDEEDFELLKFQQEHKRIQEEIDEFLKGKEIIEQIAPTKVSSNLKQVLRGLEHTTKKVNQIADAPPVVDDDDDDFDEPKFAEMGKKIKKAFNQAKVKAVMTLGGILKANGSQSPRGQEEALAQVLAAVEKEIADQEPDAVDEGEGVAELNELKQKIEAIEKEKADNLEKVKILTSENSELAQDKRELREKVLSLENDILAIKEMYQISRLEWADTKTAMKRKFEEAQQEWQKKAATPVVIYQPSVVTAPQKVEQTETFTVEQNEENYAPSQTEEKEEDEEQAAENENEDNVNEEAQSVKEQGSSQGFSNFVTETTAPEEVSASVLAAVAQKVHVNKDHTNSEAATKKITAGNEHNSSDIKSEASTKSQPGEQAKNKSRESGKRVSDNETLIHIEKQTPETQPLRIPLNNDSVSEKPRDQQANTASKSSLNSNSNPNPVQLHQNSPKPDSRNINNTKEATSPRSNIQIRNIKKTNPVPKPVQNARERNVVEPKIQMNNSIEKVIESADKGRKNVAEPKIQQNNAGERVAETSDKIRKNMLEAKNQQNNSVERVNESPDKARKNVVEPRPQQNYSVEKVVGISDKARKSPEKPNYQPNYANHAIRSQNHVRHGLELYDRIKTEGEVPDDSMDREINALNMQLGLEPKTERVGTANAIYSRGNIAKQGLINQESQQRLNTVGSPRSNRNQDTKGALSPVFSPKAEFNGGVISKGVKDDFTKQSKYYVGRQSPDWAGHSGDKGNFKGVIQSVLDIRDDYWTQADYSPKGDLKQHFNMYSKEKEGKRSALVGFGKGINSSKKIKRKSLEGLDEYKGLSSFRDRVAQQGKYNFSPINGYAVDEVSERLRSEPSSSIQKGFNPKIKAYDLYPESPRSGNGQNPQSAYYFERDPSAEARFQRHSPQPKLFKVKLTIEECIRQEVLRDTKEPASTKEEAQMRIMYRAMLTRAKQQPKVSAWMKKCIQEADLGPLNEDHPVVEYSVFEQYVTDFIQAHLPCGENCSHLRDFYAKIGYLTSWNNREVMSVKRAQIGGTAMESLLPSPKFPGLKKKKKEIEML